MRRVIRFQALGLLIPAVVGTWWLSSAQATDVVMIRPDVGVRGATPDQLAMARWAIGRFEADGLDPPAVDIEFHGDGAGCGGHLGYARQGEVDVCTTLANMSARWILLHETSHIWLDQSVDTDVRTRFLELRDLPSWNASGDAWRLRGYEQGAEIIAWSLGERILTPQIPDDGPEELAIAFRLLTGIESPGA